MCPHIIGRVEQPFGVSFTRTLRVFVNALLLWPKHFSTAPLLWGLGKQPTNFEGVTDIHTMAEVQGDKQYQLLCR